MSDFHEPPRTNVRTTAVLVGVLSALSWAVIIFAIGLLLIETGLVSPDLFRLQAQ